MRYETCSAQFLPESKILHQPKVEQEKTALLNRTKTGKYTEKILAFLNHLYHPGT